jgi:hypothetical protein
MIIVSLAANLIRENFVEPKVMSRSVDLHPLVVIGLGGMLGGIIGLIVAVPAAAVARSAVLQLRSSGHVDEIAAQARPVGEELLRSDSARRAARWLSVQQLVEEGEEIEKRSSGPE